MSHDGWHIVTCWMTHCHKIFDSYIIAGSTCFRDGGTSGLRNPLLSMSCSINVFDTKVRHYSWYFLSSLLIPVSLPTCPMTNFLPSGRRVHCRLVSDFLPLLYLTHFETNLPLVGSSPGCSCSLNLVRTRPTRVPRPWGWENPLPPTPILHSDLFTPLRTSVFGTTGTILQSENEVHTVLRKPSTSSTILNRGRFYFCVRFFISRHLIPN